MIMASAGYIDKPRKDMGTPDKPTPICALRVAMFTCTNSHIKIAAIPLHGGGAIKNWVGVYGIKTPKKSAFINPFDVFTFDGIKTPGHVSKLSNVKYVTEDKLKTHPKDKKKK
jgi:hypothetical protein